MREPRVDQLAADSEVFLRRDFWRSCHQGAAQYLRYDVESFGDCVFNGAAGDLAGDLAAACAHVGAYGCGVGLRPGYGSEEVHVEQCDAGRARWQHLWTDELCAVECAGAFLHGGCCLDGIELRSAAASSGLRVANQSRAGDSCECGAEFERGELGAGAVWGGAGVVSLGLLRVQRGGWQVWAGRSAE